MPAMCGSHKTNGDYGFMSLLMGMVPRQQTPPMELVAKALSTLRESDTPHNLTGD